MPDEDPPDSIAGRLHALEERVTTKAPAKPSATRPRVPTAAVTKALPAPAPTPGFIAEALATEQPPEPVVGTAQEAPRPPASPFGKGLKVAVALIVVLLAAAAGLGAAALIEARPSTWESTALVQLAPGEAPSVDVADALNAGVSRYRGKVANSSFTALSAFRAGVEDKLVRENVVARPVGTNELQLVARAATADAAGALATAAGQTLVETVTSEQVLAAPTKGDRLQATVTGQTGSAVQVLPRDWDATLAGGLTAAAVLLVAALVVLWRREKSSRK